MDVVGPDQCDPPSGGTAVTIGAYDGVHLGHRALLADLSRLAAARGLATAVVTFDRHPATVVRPESAPTVLNDLNQKLELLAECGIDRTLVVPFDRDRADETAEEFVTEVLVGDLGARLVVVGQDFHFGHGRKGNVEVLRELGAAAGFEVVGVDLTDTAGDPISSTRIRALVAEGAVEAAAALLGRPHQLRGTVAHGDGRGGSVLGMPTANVELAEGLALPGEGIYAGYYERPDGSVHDAAISLGRRLTFYEAAPPLLEAHLIDWSGDLYEESAKVSFVSRLRADQRFESVEALITQMNRDVDEARRRLAAARAGA
jgi:riboflavin kinase/FMN adenylyltransferase